MNTQEYDLSSSHNHDNRYPIISTESRKIIDNDYYGIYAYIINLGICKVITLSVSRKTNLSLTTSWTTLTTLTSDIRPNTNIQVSDIMHDVSIEVSSDGSLRARATSSKSTTFIGKMTYVKI